MRTATVRDLRYNFPAIEQMLALGEEIRITKRGKEIGKLTPPRRKAGNLTDFVGRIQDIFGGRKVTPSGAQLMAEERDRY